MLLHVTAIMARLQSEYEVARAMYEECLDIRRERDDRPGIVAALHNLGVTAYEQGDYRGAVAHYEESLPISRALNNTYGTAMGLASLGDAIRALGDPSQAAQHYEESLDLFRQISHTWGEALALVGLGDAARDQEDHARAATRYRESLVLSRRLGDRRALADVLERLAGVEIVRATSAAELEQAVRLLGAAGVVRQELNAPRPPVHQARYQQAFTTARNALGDETFSVAFAAGERITIEQALHDVVEHGD
jgi:tetratricopeptide (TPR) repeat protein